MEGKQFADNTPGQPLSAEYKIDNRGEPCQNPDESANRKGLLAEVHKIGAVRLFGFFYWTNIVAIVLLMIGFVAPGWITFSISQRLYYPENSYRRTHDEYKSVWVYQDYALFYMTQCTEHTKYNDYSEDVSYKICETMTYRTIDHLYRDENDDYSRIDLGDKEISGDDRCMFRGAGLVMNNSKFARVQGLYTAGILLSIFTLYIWTGYRSQLANGNFTTVSRLRWILMFIVSAMSAIFLFVPVVMFALVRTEIFSGDGSYMYNEKPLGSVFAGFGGGFMTLITIVVLMQLICCRTPGTYICSCTDEPGNSVPVIDD